MSERDLRAEAEQHTAYRQAQAELLGEYRAFRNTVRRALIEITRSLEAVDKAYAAREEAWEAYEDLAVEGARELHRRLETTERIEHAVEGVL